MPAKSKAEQVDEAQDKELEQMIDELVEVLATVGEEVVQSKCPNCGLVHNVNVPDGKPFYFSTRHP